MDGSEEVQQDTARSLTPQFTCGNRQSGGVIHWSEVEASYKGLIARGCSVNMGFEGIPSRISNVRGEMLDDECYSGNVCRLFETSTGQVLKIIWEPQSSLHASVPTSPSLRSYLLSIPTCLHVASNAGIVEICPYVI